MQNLPKNTKILIGLGVLALSYYLWKQHENKEKIKKLKDGANNCAECAKKTIKKN
jgi:hypothetical protein